MFVTNRVVADQLHARPESFGQRGPPVPIVLRHPVFDRDDRVLVAPGGEHLGPVLRRQAESFAFEPVEPVPMELAGRAIERDGDLRACGVARRVDRLQNQLDRRFVTRDAGGKATLVADGCAHAVRVDQLLQCMKHFGAVADCVGKTRSADRHDHELLQVEAVVGMRAAVDDVHHRHRHRHRTAAAEVAVQRQTGLLGGRFRHRHRHRKQRIGAEPRLVLGAVEFDQRAVEEGLLVRLETHHRLGDLGVDVLDRLQHTLAEVASPVAVTQLNRLARSGRGARRHRGAAHDAGLEQHVAFDGRVAARIEDLAADQVNDGTHVLLF